MALELATPFAPALFLPLVSRFLFKLLLFIFLFYVAGLAIDVALLVVVVRLWFLYQKN